MIASVQERFCCRRFEVNSIATVIVRAATARMKSCGIVPPARRAVHDHRFNRAAIAEYGFNLPGQAPFS